MISKIIVLIVFLVILYALGSGLYYLVREGIGSRKLVVALTWRIALSLGLFAFMILAYFLGWIAPHALMTMPVTH
jgi:hypothetical protein